MRVTRILTIGAAIAIGTTSLAGCGDDEAAALTKPEFITQADTICQAAQDEIVPIFDVVWEGFDELDEDDPADQNVIFERYNGAVEAAVPIWAEMADDIRALNPPTDDRALITAMLDDLKTGLDEMQNITSAAADGDTTARESMDNDELDPLVDVNRRAREYGLSVCGDES